MRALVILTTIAIIASISTHTPRPVGGDHDHNQVNIYYANGLKHITLTMCHTTEMQVRSDGVHVKTKTSEEYFRYYFP